MLIKTHPLNLLFLGGFLVFGVGFQFLKTTHAGPITGGAGNPPYTKLAVYQGIVSIVPGGTTDNLLEIGNGGRDIAGTGSIFIRPDSLNSASINYAEFYKDIGNRASLKVPGTLSIGTQKNHTIGTIISPDTQAKTYEIARIGFDQNNWSYNSAVYITLDQNYWGSGGQKKYVVRAGFNENTGLVRLIEANGPNDVMKEVKVRITGPFQNGVCNVGGPPSWLPCLKYIRVFADVDFYTRWDVHVSHSMTDTSNTIPGAAHIRIFTDGTSGNDWNLNIASFDSSEAVVNELTNTFNQNVNVAGSVCFGAPTFTDCHNTWTDLSGGPVATQHWVDDGATADTASYATIGVTRSAVAANNSYIGLTRAGIFAWGIGVGSSSNLIFGQASASPAKTIPTPFLSIGNTGGVTVPTGNLSVSSGDLTIGGVALARNQLPNAMSFGATSNATMTQGVGSYAFISPLLNNGSYNNLSQNGDSGLFYGDASGFVIGPWASSNEGIRIGVTGNVGIGEAPNGLWKLQVNGAAVATMFIDRDWSQRNLDPSGNSRIENLQLEQLQVNDYRNISVAPDVATNNWNWVTVASRSYNVGNGGGMRLDPSPDNAWYSVQLDPVKHPLAIYFDTWTDDAGICIAGFYDEIRNIWYKKVYVGRFVNVLDLDLDAGFQASDVGYSSFLMNDGNYGNGFHLNEMHGGRNNTGPNSSGTYGWMKRLGLDRIPPGLKLYYKLGYASDVGNSGVNCTISIVYSES